MVVFIIQNPSVSSPNTRAAAEGGDTEIERSEKPPNNRETLPGAQNMKFTDGVLFHDVSLNGVRIYLQIFGLACCVVGVTQFGVGSVAATYLVSVRDGAWWATLAVFFAGVCAVIGRNKSWVKGVCFFSSTGFVIALIAAINDSLSVKVINSLSSCGSVASGNTITYGDYKSYLAKMISYGKPADNENIAYCMVTADMLNEFQFDRCYCVTSSGGFCWDYSINSKSLYRSQNCGNILTTYAKTLQASQSFCAISTILMLVLFIFSCYILFQRYTPSDLQGLDSSPIETQKPLTTFQDQRQYSHNHGEEIHEIQEIDNNMLRSS